MDNFIAELRELIEEDAEGFSKQDLQNLLNHTLELKERGVAVIFHECGNCHGFGRHTLYEDSWACGSCFGLGGNYREK